MRGHARTRGVFSAHAEVVPRIRASMKHSLGILRARGGSSRAGQIEAERGRYSPRTRR